jgi:hypothetical protein
MLNVVTVRAKEDGAKLVHVNIQRMDSILNMRRLIITAILFVGSRSVERAPKAETIPQIQR